MWKWLAVAGWDTEAVITTTNDHNLKTGDIVTYQSAFDASGATGEQIFGLTSGISYAVKKVSDKTFSLTNLDGTAMAKYGRDRYSRFWRWNGCKISFE